MEGLQKLKTKRTLAEQIYDTLKDAIIQLTLKPGQLITEEELAELLGVSRTPLRTAVNKLMHEDLIVFVPGKGTFVSELTNKQLADIFEVRNSIELLSVNLAAQYRTEEDALKLKKMIDAQSKLDFSQKDGYRQFFTADLEIHSFISGMGKNDYLIKILKPIMINCSRYLYTTLSEQAVKNAVNEHYEIYECILKQDSEAAEAALHKHVSNIRNRMMSDLIKEEIATS